jgi:hypothetical protein
MGHMAPIRTTNSKRNKAAASYLRGVKASADPRITTPQLAELSGVPFERLKRLLGNQMIMTMDDFSSVAEALGLDPGQALREANAKVISE